MKQFLIIVVAIALTFGLTDIVQANAGDLDPLFDLDGKVITDLGATEFGYAIALQPDGKVIVGGFIGGTIPDEDDFVLVRYNPNGSLDPTFGSGGIVTTDFAAKDDFLNDICLQTDGKIVATGQTTLSNGESDFGLARYNPNGSLDPTFGNGGKVTTNIAGSGDRPDVVAVQSDGKIIAAGFTSPVPSDTDFVVVRYNPNGSLDPTFGVGGIVMTNLSTGVSDRVLDVVIEPNGKIIAAGAANVPFDFALVRYNPNGSLDPTFGTGGVVFTGFAVGGSDNAYAVRLQPDGKIIAAGAASSLSFDFALVRYNPNGSLDPTFGNGGKLTTDFGGTDFALAIAIQQNDKIVVGGTALSNFALARYNPTGSLDPTFGPGGLVTTDFAGGSDLAYGVALQSDGKIILAGNTNNDIALARYEGDIILTSCMFTDDFEDGILAPDWTYVKPLWSEAGGSLIGTPTGGKAEVIATPATAGCGTGTCTVQTSMQTAGGASNKIFFFGWFQDKDNTIEVLMKEESDKWILRQRVGGVIVAKVKAPRTILPNIVYDVKVTFDGNTFTLFVDGFNLVSMNAAAVPSGTIGYRVKNTTGMFGSVCIN